MRTSKYTDAIKSKDLTLVLDVFNSELETFLQTESDIYLDFMSTDESEHKKTNHLRMLYSKTWTDFCENTPFLLQMKCHNEDGWLRLSDITGKEPLVTSNTRLCHNIVDAIVRYTTYIHITKNMYYREFIIWQSLLLTTRVVDVTRFLIQPEDIISKVNRVMKEVDDGTFSKPQATLYQSKLYPYRLSSSAKVTEYRRRVIDEWLEDYVVKYKDKYHRIPTRQETKDYVVACCIRSKDPRLKLFTDGINLKTFRKYSKSFKLARSITKNNNSQMPIISKDSTPLSI